jgi:YHS domain-containing protein
MLKGITYAKTTQCSRLRKGAPGCTPPRIPRHAGESEYNGQTYYFCSLGCKKAFDENPEKYLDKADEHQG